MDSQGGVKQQEQATDINNEEGQLQQEPNEEVPTNEAGKPVEEEDIDDEDNLSHQTFNDEDADMYLEIDLFGTADLNEDDRIDALL